MKKGSRATGVMEAYKPESHLRLEGEHAKKAKGHEVGETHTITMKAKKTGHTINSDGSHSVTYQPTSVDFEQESGEGNKGGKGSKEREIESDSDQPQM